MAKSKVKVDEVAIATSSTSALMTQNKKTIKSAVVNIMQLIEEGHYDSLKALIFSKKMTFMAKELEDAVKQIAFNDSKITKGEVYKLYDVEVTKKDTGVKWDYSLTGDKTWNELNDLFIKVKEEKDVRETFLQGVTKKMEFVDEDTGETWTIHPPIRKAGESLVISIK